MDIQALCATIRPLDEEAMRFCRARWDSIAKPLGSLGLLEAAVVRIAGLQGNASVSLKKRAVTVFCADNGVVCEGVTQTGQSVTALVAGNMACGEASVCHMARVAGAEVLPVDIGMLNPAEGVLDRRIRPGTGNIAVGPAMSRHQAEDALRTGIELVAGLKNQGYGILATGEMGIGNTTTSSALCAVLLGLPAAAVTGRGAGLSDAALERKVDVIQRAIHVNAPDEKDPIDVLHKLGGLDIAGLAGVFLGGAIYRTPVLIDGFISAVAALVAARICPESVCAMLASHVSAEPAARLVLETLGLHPLIQAGLRLGEGTGAVCALPLLDMALSVYDNMSTFDGIGIKAYRHLGGENP